MKGTIPACREKLGLSHQDLKMHRNHPCVQGEAPVCSEKAKHLKEPFLRAGRSQRCGRPVRAIQGTIPACRENLDGQILLYRGKKNHPCVQGEARDVPNPFSINGEPSLRAGRSLIKSSDKNLLSGTIPACRAKPMRFCP